MAQPVPMNDIELTKLIEQYRSRLIELMECKPRQLRIVGTTTLFEIDGLLYIFDRDTHMLHARDTDRILAHSGATSTKIVHKLAPLYAGHRVLVNNNGDVRTSCNTYMDFSGQRTFTNTFALSVDEEFDCINCETRGVPEGWFVIPRVIIHRDTRHTESSDVIVRN